ncbi:MAG: hypothetical protein ABI907_01660 [Ramlibacter sp.]
MNDAPRSYLTPADRDAAMFEASKLRAMSLRREAVERFGNTISQAASRIVHSVLQAVTRSLRQSRREA